MPIDPSDLGDVTLDIGTLTLGEASELEKAAGEDIATLLARSSGRMMAAVFVHVSRSSGRVPLWSEVSNLALLDVSSSTSRARSGGPPPRSRG